MVRVTLTTSDTVTIVGNYYKGSADRGALLVHMMPATKESWDVFARVLENRGYHVLAIDMRGHGESAGGPEGYKSFSDEEHQRKIHDVEAGAAFLLAQGSDANTWSIGRYCERFCEALRNKISTRCTAPVGSHSEKLIVIGASIGANLCLQYLAEHPLVTCGVLLSAGLSYRGVNAEKQVQELHSGQRVFFVTSEDDHVAHNAEMNKSLYALVPDGVEKKLLTYRHAGHGTDMFGKEEPDLQKEILVWL